jgi:SNF2 family DNA or RNA helicase
MFGGKPASETRLIRQDEIAKYLGSTVHYLEDLDADKKPRKVSINIPVEMSSQQVKIYRQTMKGMDPRIRAKIASGQAVTQKEASTIFKRILDARRVSNSLHEHIPGMSLEQASEASPKIRKILNDVQTHMKVAPDAQIIIYSNLVSGGVDVIAAGLKKRGVSYGIFSGARKDVGVTKESRQQAVVDYKSGKNKVIIITSAGAEGLSLGNTTMVMVADPHYNPERTAQAEARGIRAKGLAHRPKERRKVIVRRYVSKIPRNFWQKITFSKGETGIDEWVYRTAGRKARATRQLRQVLGRPKEKSLKERIFGG